MKSPLLLPVVLSAFLVLAMSTTEPKGYTVGDVASNFSLKSVKGNIVSMSDYADAKGLIVVFTCNHCPFAQLYEQRIIDLHNTFAPQGFPVVAINSNSPLIVPEDSYEEMQLLAKEKQYPFEYLFDEDQIVYPMFGATRTPQIFILDANRVVRYIGAIDNNAESPNASTQRWAHNAVKALLKGERPNPEFTRAAGCTIKKAPPPPVQATPSAPVPELTGNDNP